jgi:hypothetical protein
MKSLKSTAFLILLSCGYLLFFTPVFLLLLLITLDHEIPNASAWFVCALIFSIAVLWWQSEANWFKSLKARLSRLLDERSP